MSNDKYKITEEEQEKIKLYTARSLPNNPTERGMSPAAIKAFFYKFLEPLFKVLNDKYSLIEAGDFRSITSARYVAPDKYLLNSYVNDISVIPEGAAYIGELKEAMTSYLTDEYLGSAEALFYKNQEDTENSEAGFVIDLDNERNIGFVQIYVLSVIRDATMNAYISSDGVSFQKCDTLNLAVTPVSNVLCAYRFKIGKKARYLKIVQEGDDHTNGTFAMKGIEIYEANYEGRYIIKQQSGNVIELDTFIASSLVDELICHRDMAKTWAEGEAVIEGLEEDGTAKYSAKHWASKSQALYDDIDDKKGKVNGYAPLEEVDGQVKIPSVYINQFDHKRHIKITSEDELDTLISNGTAQGGDIAILIESVYEVDSKGNKIEGTEVEAITKTWLLYAEYDSEEKEIAGSQEWIRYGLSYATNAGYSTYANNAGNSQKINGIFIQQMTESAYEALSVKPSGVCITTIGE